MNKLNRDCFNGHDTIFFVQIFPLVVVNSSSTRPAYKRDFFCIYTRKIVK